jgi:hypothetical protein
VLRVRAGRYGLHRLRRSYTHPSAGLVSLHQREAQRLLSFRFRLLGVAGKARRGVWWKTARPGTHLFLQLRPANGLQIALRVSIVGFAPNWGHLTKRSFMYASAVRSFGIRGNLAILGHVGRRRSKDGCIQDRRRFAIRTTRFSPPKCRRTRQAIDVRIGAGQANPRRLLLEI